MSGRKVHKSMIILYRYAGQTAMAILGPYGFQETHSDDWVGIL